MAEWKVANDMLLPPCAVGLVHDTSAHPGQLWDGEGGEGEDLNERGRVRGRGRHTVSHYHDSASLPWASLKCLTAGERGEEGRL